MLCPPKKGFTEEDYYFGEWSAAEREAGEHLAAMKFVRPITTLDVNLYCFGMLMHLLTGTKADCDLWEAQASDGPPPSVRGKSTGLVTAAIDTGIAAEQIVDSMRCCITSVKAARPMFPYPDFSPDRYTHHRPAAQAPIPSASVMRRQTSRSRSAACCA